MLDHLLEPLSRVRENKEYGEESLMTGWLWAIVSSYVQWKKKQLCNSQCFKKDQSIN